MGQIYVRLDASVVGKSANALNTSEPEGGTGTSGSYWLRWNSEGFIGNTWFWGEPYSYLPEGWVNAVNSGQTGCDVDHGVTQGDFISHVSQGHVENLNLILGGWPDEEKTAFVVLNAPKLNYVIGEEPTELSCVTYNI